MGDVPETTPKSTLAALTAFGLAASLGLAACSSDAGSAASEGSTPDATATSTPTGSVTPTDQPAAVPAGVEVTAPGTQLAFGDTATVARTTKKQTAVLDLRVDSAKQGSLDDFGGFDLDDPYKRKGSYYYVRVTVKNKGKKRLDEMPVPLWGVSGRNTLLQAVDFTSSFSKCPTQALPTGFKPGATFKTCLVYLSPDHGSLAGVSYRPTEDYQPIQWQGKVDLLPKDGKKSKKKAGKSGG